MWEIMHGSEWVVFSSMITIDTVAIWVMSFVEVWLRVVLSTVAPITVESLMAIECFVVRVVSAVVVAVTPVTIVEVVSSECKCVSIVGLSLVSIVSTILVSAPAAVIRKLATEVLRGMWLSVCFFEHGSIIWAMWLSVLLR